MKPPIPENEAARLEALRQFEILDTDPEDTFDDIARLAAYICDTPIALISLIDADRQWFKSQWGVTLQNNSRDVSFCAHAVLQPGTLIVRDALDDDRFRQNPLVISDPYIRFYAGSPLTSVEGYQLGTLCVIDRKPREPMPEQVAALQMLGNQVMTLLEARRTVTYLTGALNEKRKRVKELEERLGQHKEAANEVKGREAEEGGN